LSIYSLKCVWFQNEEGWVETTYFCGLGWTRFLFGLSDGLNPISCLITG
jgi:hypothetical protein